MNKLKILNFTDCHISYKTPASRIDNYQEAIYEKLKELIDLANNEDIDLILCGGDLFHSSTPSPNSVMIANQISELFNKSEVPIYVVPGNHDISGYNTSTIDKTLLGIYIANRTVNVLDRKFPLIHFLGDKKIAIEGQEYHIGIDKYNKDDFTCRVEADFNILVAHAMVTHKAITDYYKRQEVSHIDLDSIETNANIVLTGHEHNGYETIKTGNTTFANPGSLSRVDSASKHMPKAYIIEVDEDLNYDIKDYYLNCAKDYDEVFDNTIKEEKKSKERVLDNFKRELKEISINNVSNIGEMVHEVAKTLKVDQSIIDKSFDYLNQASENDLSSKHISKQYELFIESVELINFQSHEKTTINFTNKLNALIGISDSGKTAALRGIIWCLYNSPKGTEFIRTGEKEVSVTVTFSDGTYIKRTRTEKNSGSYEVCDSDGEIKQFEGFGNEIPMEVINEHQMPGVNVTKDKVVNVNIAEQLEAPFLLNEPASIKASAIGKITHTDKIDTAIKEISSDSKALQKEIKILSKQKEDKEEQLKKYKNLDKDKILLDKLDKVVADYKEVEAKISELESYKVNYNKIENNIKQYEDILSTTVDKASIESKITKCMDIVEALREFNIYSNSLKNIDRDIELYSKNIEYMLDHDKVNAKMNELSLVIEKCIAVEASITELDKMNHVINRAIKTCDDANAMIQQGEKAIESQKKLLEEELNKLDICTVCGSEITKEQKQFIRGEI